MGSYWMLSGTSMNYILNKRWVAHERPTDVIQHIGPGSFPLIDLHSSSQDQWDVWDSRPDVSLSESPGTTVVGQHQHKLSSSSNFSIHILIWACARKVGHSGIRLPLPGSRSLTGLCGVGDKIARALMIWLTPPTHTPIQQQTPREWGNYDCSNSLDSLDGFWNPNRMMITLWNWFSVNI